MDQRVKDNKYKLICNASTVISHVNFRTILYRLFREYMFYSIITSCFLQIFLYIRINSHDRSLKLRLLQTIRKRWQVFLTTLLLHCQEFNYTLFLHFLPLSHNWHKSSLILCFQSKGKYILFHDKMRFNCEELLRICCSKAI